MKQYSKKICLVLTLFMMITLALTGCQGASPAPSGEPKDELVISVGSGQASGGYDPCTGYGTYGYGIFHSALLKFNPKIEVEPDLATGYTVSDDGLTYTYKLREGLKFSDGEPIKASDVAFTYMTAKKSGSSVDLTMLDRAEAPDDLTVVFTLNRRWSPFASTTALLGIVPEHAYDENYGDNPVCSGPFKVAQLNKDQQVIVVPNEYYHGKKSPFKKITILDLDEEAALASAKSGQLDVVMVNPEYALEEVAGMRLETFKTVDNRGFNLPVIAETKDAEGNIIGNNVTCNFEIRKALNIGIDRVTIIKNALNGIGVPAYGRVDALPWCHEQTAFEDKRVKEACDLLESSGWIDTDGDGIREKNGQKAEFRITGRTDDLQRYNLAVALSEDAKKLGINIIAEAVAWEDCKKMSRNIPTCWGSGNYSPIDLYNEYSTNNLGVGIQNTASYSSPKVDAYFEKALGATSMEEAIKYWKLAQWDGEGGINADYPYLWIVNIDHTYFVREGLDLGEQRIHPHGHGAPVIANLNEWSYK
jgi:peptide/nickel transport system substrate-binding protein